MNTKDLNYIILGRIVLNNEKGFENIQAVYAANESDLSIKVYFTLPDLNQTPVSYRTVLAKTSLQKSRQLILVNDSVKADRSRPSVRIGFGSFTPVYSKIIRDSKIEGALSDQPLVMFDPKEYGFG